MFCQDVNEQFEGYTQRKPLFECAASCLIRMLMNNLKDIHNQMAQDACETLLFLIRMSMNNLKDIHNYRPTNSRILALFNQDVNEQFAAKLQKMHEIYKFLRKNFVISTKSTTFAPTNLKDIHNKDYSVV